MIMDKHGNPLPAMPDEVAEELKEVRSLARDLYLELTGVKEAVFDLGDPYQHDWEGAAKVLGEAALRFRLLTEV